MKDRYKLLLFVIVFLIFNFIPFSNIKIQSAIIQSFLMLQDYAQKHIVLCLIPAFFIAGAMSVFLSQSKIMKYLGSKANRILSYTVASISGSILAVCSCTVLPLFTGIYRMGAGIGPATAFLYSGPAINVLAVILTTKVLGLQFGIARAIGAVLFAIIIGLLMSLTFRNEEHFNSEMVIPEDQGDLSNKRNIILFIVLIAILIFANWMKFDENTFLFYFIYNIKWYITSILGIIFSIMLIKWFNVKWFIMLITGIVCFIFTLFFSQYPLIIFSIGVIGIIIGLKFADNKAALWLNSTKSFAFQILPLLFIGILIAGFLLGMPGSENGLIPSKWISSIVGGNSFSANLFASIIGVFMYFATLTEIPILQGLLNSGMGKGPALALLLAGPALSLPNMFVIRSVLGTKRTIMYVSYVIILSTLAGIVFGSFVK